MSYILDALRKADAERARGAVPDLHAQPVLRSSAGTAPASGAQPWAWAAGAVAVTAVCGLAWVLLLARDPGRESAAAGAPAAPGAAGASVSATAQAPVPAPVPTAATTVPMAASPSAPARVALAPARPPPARAVPRTVIDPVRPALRKPAPDPDGLAPATATAATTATTATTAAAPPPAPTQPDAAARLAEPRLYTQAELPDEIRRALPTLAIGGAMYSEHAASRMLIINGQVFHERDKLAPNLTLVQIRLKTAVLDFRGYRYSVSY